MRYQPQYAIGLLRDQQGHRTTNPEETIEILASTSFPNSHEMGTEEEFKVNLKKLSDSKGKFTPKTDQWRNKDRIKEAINSFDPMKAAGPDGIKPIVLQALPDNYIGKNSGNK